MKNSTKVFAHLPPCLLRTFYSVKVIKISTDPNEVGAPPAAARVAAETVRHAQLLMSPLFPQWLKKSRLFPAHSFLQKHSWQRQELCSAPFWHCGQKPWFLPSGFCCPGVELGVRRVCCSGAAEHSTCLGIAVCSQGRGGAAAHAQGAMVLDLGVWGELGGSLFKGRCHGAFLALGCESQKWHCWCVAHVPNFPGDAGYGCGTLVESGMG